MSINHIIEKIDRWSTQPSRVAYRTLEREYSYTELKTYSDNFAIYLHKNISNKSPILIFGELEFEMIIGFLGASKSGHAYIPVDKNTPTERIQLIIDTAQPSMILTIADWVDISVDIPIIDLYALNNIIHSVSMKTILSPIIAEDTYYVIFTSGTTGIPKGVQITYNNLITFVEWVLEDFSIYENMSFLLQSPYSFDLSIMSLYPALVSGGCLVPLEKKVTSNFKTLFNILPMLNLDIWISTPSFLDICLFNEKFKEQYFPNLSLFLLCGEELPRKTAQNLLSRFPNSKIYNTYGPTEATVAISSIQITDQILKSYNRIPLGFIKKDTQVTIMDEQDQLLNGSIGEIVISGPNVSKGYINNISKTNSSFFNLSGKPTYRTGDLGSLSSDGLLFYNGRIDFQVKINGYRIELGDIEYHLNTLDYVNQAIVIPKYKDSKVHHLVAFLLCERKNRNKERQLADKITTELSKLVMDYMVPKKLIFIEEFPLTINGKIDRTKLTNQLNKLS